MSTENQSPELVILFEHPEWQQPLFHALDVLGPGGSARSDRRKLERDLCISCFGLGSTNEEGRDRGGGASDEVAAIRGEGLLAVGHERGFRQ